MHARLIRGGLVGAGIVMMLVLHHVEAALAVSLTSVATDLIEMGVDLVNARKGK